MDAEADIVVVGAGAAGLAAAVTLQAAPVKTLVLEARDRIGGRAMTVSRAGMALDLGAGWLHSADRNPFAHIAERLGFRLDKTPPAWMEQTFGVGFGPGEERAFADALSALETRIAEAARRGEDRPVAELMLDGCRWNPLLDAFSSYYNGAEFDRISTADYDAYQDTEVNWRVEAGYGALVAAWAEGARVVLDCPVTAVDLGGPGLRLETARGSVSARAAILSLPTPLYAGVAFTPALPEVQEAAAALPLGLADKVLLELRDPRIFPKEGHLFGDPASTATGSYHLRPFGRPLVEAFLGGRNAEALEAEGEGAAAAFAIEELVGLLGSDMRKGLHALAASAWRREPFSRGSYSYAQPGRADARAALARPVDGRLFFAGEATSADAFSTVHGAAATGARAAREALKALGLAPPPEAS